MIKEIEKMKDRCKLETRIKRRERGRRGEYKEDCTDGRFSILNPVRFKGDALVQVWLDSRELATISEWLDKGGQYTRFLSEVVKEGLHILCENIVENGEIKMVEETIEARNLLEDKYDINLNPNERGKKNVFHNQMLSERKKEEREAVPDKVRELQKIAHETYRNISGKSSIFDELEKIEKGETNGTDES
jgi:hypothetical protein